MMKSMISLTLFLFMSTSWAIETCDYEVNSSDDYDSTEDVFSTEMGSVEKAVIEAEKQYRLELAINLLENEDINVRMMALKHLDFSFYDELKTANDDSVVDAKFIMSMLNLAVESDSATTATLLSAQSICESTLLKGQCEVEMFNEKLFNFEPDNLIIYFSDLNSAVENSDAELVDSILKQMSQARYSSSLNPITDEIINAVDAFIDKNPINESIDLSAMRNLFPEKNSLDVAALYPQNILQMIHVSNYNLPALRPLMVACEAFQSNIDNCQQIANTLINHSDTRIMAMIGYGLDEKIQEVFGDKKSLEKSKAAYQAFSDYQSCLLKNHGSVDELFVFDPEYVKIMTMGIHEGTHLELAAVYLYEKYKNSSSIDLVDPETCGLKYMATH